MRRPPVKWGIAGLGNMGQRMAHAMLEAEGASVGGLWSRTTTKAEALSGKFSGAAVYRSYDEMVRDASLDAVYVATLNAQHVEHALAALRHGKHVLVEKPMAVELSGAEALVSAAREAGRQLGVGFHLRFHPVHRAMRERIEAGDIGELVFAQAMWGVYRPSYPRDAWQVSPELAGAGSLYGLGVHVLDLLCWLIGSEVTEVTAMSDAASSGYGVDFITTGLLRFRCGAMAQFTGSRRFPNGANSVTVYGAKERLDGRATLAMSAAGDLVAIEGERETVKRFPLRNLYTLEIEAFSEAISEGRSFAPSAEEGLRSVQISLAALEAARTARRQRLSRATTWLTPGESV